MMRIALLLLACLFAGCGPSVSELQQQVLIEQQKLDALMADFDRTTGRVAGLQTRAADKMARVRREAGSIEDIERLGADAVRDVEQSGNRLLDRAEKLVEQIGEQKKRLAAAEAALEAAR